MQRRVPPVVADYFLGGASDEQTLSDNVEAFKRARFNPSYGVKLGAVDMSTTVLGHKISMPVIAAPVGSLRSSAALHSTVTRLKARIRIMYFNIPKLLHFFSQV
jgi:isopentenyl diphosphate isomerase/L-lactate dehydrogenase-like FMN-dependent dehydrogenase